jgi:predicted nucleotidyltransferase
VAEAAEQVGARVAILFGSQVTGRTWAESDLDVAVSWDWRRTDEERHRATLELIALLTDRLGALGERADVLDLDRGSSAVAFKAIRALFRRLYRHLQ